MTTESNNPIGLHVISYNGSYGRYIKLVCRDSEGKLVNVYPDGEYFRFELGR